VVKSTSENTLPNNKKISDRLKKRSGKAVSVRSSSAQTRNRRPRSGAASTSANAVFLVGFMGAGKTSVGRALGQLLNWAFEDLDDRIERREGRTVAEIFRDSGESGFRQAEHGALQNLLEELRGGGVRIVALGGGAFVQKKNAALLSESRLPTVFLDAPVEELWQRCRQQASEAGTQRPLLRSQQEFRRLYDARRKSYAKASFRIQTGLVQADRVRPGRVKPGKLQTGNRSVDEIAAEIAKKLGLKKVAIRTEQGEVE
jgi:shikimate kinase